jgi:hypothetical protein
MVSSANPALQADVLAIGGGVLLLFSGGIGLTLRPIGTFIGLEWDEVPLEKD